ncbi:MAG TPA: hypothetical protein PLD55_14980, partial [bacterium]|nr:hypothetical protein [bacterium]
TLLCDEMGILRIDGIEKIINLNYLSLTRNNIKDFSLLKNLKSLKTLDIIGNINTNVETLGELSSLEELEAGNCGLTELGAIINLVELKKLSISPNNIKSIEEVKNLTGLKFLSVPTNYLQNEDLPVLLNLVNLEHLNVEENCLTDFTITNELREKGVEVVVGQQDTTRCK